MNKLRALLFLELRSAFGINKLIHTKDPKEKQRSMMLGVAWIIIIGMIFMYVGSLVLGLCAFGLAHIVPSYLALISSAVILMFGIFSAGHRIFGQRGYELLAAMPVTPRAVVASRFLALYIEDLIFTAAVMLPGLGVYAYLMRPGFLFYFSAVLGTLFVPAIPLVISVLFGTLVFFVSSRLKRKSLAQTLISVVFVLAVLALSFSMESLSESIDEGALMAQLGNIGAVIEGFYPPAALFGAAVAKGKLLSLLLLCAVSAAAALVAVIVISKIFVPTVRRLSSFSTKSDYKVKRLEHRGLLRALYMREAKRYFSSSIYVTNTIVGPILGAVAAVALIFVELPIDISEIAPFAFAAIFCMMTTSCVSISMEGDRFWIVRSLPIPSKALFDSKILLNLSLMAPFYVISEVALAIALRPSPMELLWLILIPAAMMLFCVVFGITVNIRFHRFDWTQEAAVVKQSLPSALGGFAGFFLSAVLGVIAFLMPATAADIVKAVICAALLCAAAVLYTQNNKKDLIEL